MVIAPWCHECNGPRRICRCYIRGATESATTQPRDPDDARDRRDMSDRPTVLHVCTEQQVLEALRGEHRYQFDKLGEKAQDRSLDEWIMYMKDYMDEAHHQSVRCDEGKAIDTLRKVMAMGLTCMLQNGAPHREGY